MINILTCIYLRDGRAIHILKQGQSLFCDGDACAAARILSLVGDIIVIDLNAMNEPQTYASSHVSPNTQIIKEMLTFAKVRVYGGLHTATHALDWLDQGVTKAIVPADKATDMRQDIPAERLVAAINVTAEQLHVIGQDGTTTNQTVFDFIASLSSVDEFLITFVDGQGSLCGIQSRLTTLQQLSQTKKSLIVTGGIATTADILAIDKLGLTPLVGTALHTNQLDLGDVIVAYTKSDRPDGLFATVVVDEQSVALGLVYSNAESIRAAVKQRKGIYHSRSRGLWEKGLTSGAHQDLLAVHLDCDRDTLRFTVHQHGAGFCHLERRTCWSGDQGIGGLMRTLESRKQHPVPNSYTNRLFNDPALLHNKLLEEAHELIEAKDRDDIAWEAADVIYFASVLCANAGVSLSQIENMLDRRTLRIRRRAGDAKPLKPDDATTTSSSSSSSSS